MKQKPGKTDADEPVAPSGEFQAPTSTQKILIVDDKAENLYALEKLLAHTNAEIV